MNQNFTQHQIIDRQHQEITAAVLAHPHEWQGGQPS
jgi:hypothetical protein